MLYTRTFQFLHIFMLIEVISVHCSVFHVAFKQPPPPPPCKTIEMLLNNFIE